MLNYDPRIGEILQCHFGPAYGRGPDGRIAMNGLSLQTRLPPEMVKNRLVVVMNNKLNGGCIVVPLSRTLQPDRLSRRWHVEIAAELIMSTGHFTSTVRYAAAEQVQTASRLRLDKLSGGRKQHLPRSVVAEIQRAVVRAVGGASLLMLDEI